jgi:NitT/TauT family transport system substrate-binding protein
MKFTRKQTLELAAGSAASAFFPAVARAQSATIRIGQNANDVFGEGYYGADQGFFSAAGLNVEVSTFPNGAAQAAACAGGAIDVGLGEATELANGIIRGLPFSAFAGGALYDSAAPISALIVAADSSFRTAKDLEGQTIAVSALTSVASVAVKAWLVQNGADLTKVRFVELTQGAMVAAVVRGTVTGAHVGEPLLSAGGTTIRRIGAPNDAIAKQFLINEWFATHDWLAANAATAKRLTTAIYDTARWANGHHDASAVILAKYAKLDLDRIHGMTRVRYATSLEPRLIQPVLDQAFTYGGLPRHVDAAEMLPKT